jgi:hypothetical protein
VLEDTEEDVLKLEELEKLVEEVEPEVELLKT